MNERIVNMEMNFLEERLTREEGLRGTKSLSSVFLLFAAVLPEPDRAKHPGSSHSQALICNTVSSVQTPADNKVLFYLNLEANVPILGPGAADGSSFLVLDLFLLL